MGSGNLKGGECQQTDRFFKDVGLFRGFANGSACPCSGQRRNGTGMQQAGAGCFWSVHALYVMLSHRVPSSAVDGTRYTVSPVLTYIGGIAEPWPFVYRIKANPREIWLGLHLMNETFCSSLLLKLLRGEECTYIHTFFSKMEVTMPNLNRMKMVVTQILLGQNKITTNMLALFKAVYNHCPAAVKHFGSHILHDRP